MKTYNGTLHFVSGQSIDFEKMVHLNISHGNGSNIDTIESVINSKKSVKACSFAIMSETSRIDFNPKDILFIEFYESK